MKIGLMYDRVHPWLKGGGEKSLHDLGTGLAARGHEVHWFGMNCWGGRPDREHDGLRLHGLSPLPPLYSADGRRAVGPPLRFALGVLLRLPRHLRGGFDLFDVHAFPFLSVPAFVLARALFARRLPWVLTWLEVWGPGYWRRYLGRAGWVGAALERWCARAAPAHLCISPTTARRLHELFGVPWSKIHVIPRGFRPPGPGWAAGPPEPDTAVVAGRLLDYKRVDLALRAWAEVARHRPAARLHVVGDGAARPALERLAGELGLGGSVRFHGQLDDQADVLRRVASSALLLQPSAREGQSLVVLEALSLGVPVLAATGAETAVGDFIGDTPETAAMVLPVEAGPAEWAARIVGLLGDPARRAALAEAGRRRVAALDWAGGVAPRVEELYRRLAGPSEARRWQTSRRTSTSPPPTTTRCAAAISPSATSA
jgi:glycosyltransferase involved in cell wall biosynthesis